MDTSEIPAKDSLGVFLSVEGDFMCGFDDYGYGMSDGMGNMGYGMGSMGYGGMPPRKYSSTEIIYGIQSSLCAQYGTQFNFVIQRIEDFPPQFRHACAQGFISYLPQQVFSVTDKEGLRQFPFYFCPKCGKLYIVKKITPML